MFTPDQKSQLAAKLDGQNVKSRSQAGRNLSYLEGWFVIAEANRIFGFDGWDRELKDLVQVCEPYEKDGKWRVSYRATVRINVTAGDRTIFRDGTGYGSGIDKDLGQAHESALKESETDAMKRALMTFGNPFGLALYDKTQENVMSAQEKAAAANRTVSETAAGSITVAIEMCNDRNELIAAWKDNLKQINLLPDDLKADVLAAKDKRKAQLQQPAQQAAE